MSDPASLVVQLLKETGLTLEEIVSDLEEADRHLAKELDKMKDIFKESEMTISQFVKCLQDGGFKADIFDDSIRIWVDEYCHTISFEELVK